jgi:hypothetical protein
MIGTGLKMKSLVLRANVNIDMHLHQEETSSGTGRKNEYLNVVLGGKAGLQATTGFDEIVFEHAALLGQTAPLLVSLMTDPLTFIPRDAWPRAACCALTAAMERACRSIVIASTARAAACLLCNRNLACYIARIANSTRQPWISTPSSPSQNR